MGPLAKALPKGFLPKNDEAQFQVEVRTPEGTSLAATQIAAERIARDAPRVARGDHHPLTIGDNQQKTPNLA